MKMNKNVAGLAVVVVGLSMATQVPVVFAEQGANEHSPVSVSSVAISEATAIATAQTKLAGAMTKSHLSRDHGKATWKIRILSTDGTQRGDFRIDAITGDILKFVIKPVRGHHADRAAKLVAKAEAKRLHLVEKQHKLEVKMALKKKHLEEQGR